MQEQAAALAARPEMTSAGDSDAKITALYRLALGRTALVPAACPDVTIHPIGEMTVLEAFLP